MAKSWNIAILGSTGSVGEALLEILNERKFPVREIFLLSKSDRIGEYQCFRDKNIMIQDVDKFDWTRAQLAFFAVDTKAASDYIEEAIYSGCLIIDFSGLFAFEPDVPLVVPAVNAFTLMDYRNRNIVTIPHSLTSQLLTALKPLIDIGGLSRIHVTSFLPVSSKGKKAINALAEQSIKLLNGIPISEKDDFFGHQLAFNILPILPNQEGIVREERRIVDEVRKILQDDKLMISVNCVQTPVFYGNAQMVSFESLRVLTAEEAIIAFSHGEDIFLSKESQFLTQAHVSSRNALIFIGCVRNDYGMSDQIQFWSVSDNVRFGGALMAVKIIERLVQEYLY